MISKKLAVPLSMIILFCYSITSIAGGLHFGIINAIEGKVEELREKRYEIKTAFSDVTGQTTINSVLLDAEVHISTESADDGQPLSGIQTDLYTDGEIIIVVGSDPQGRYFPMPFLGSSDTLSSNTRSSKIKQQSTLGIIRIFLKLASFAGNVHSFTKNLPSWDADKVSNLPGVTYMGSASFGNVGDMLGIGSFVLYATGVGAGVAFVGSLASYGIEIAGILGVDIKRKYDWYLLTLVGVGVILPIPSTVINNPPNPPSSPSPADGATNQSINTNLSWSGGDPDSWDSATYDVYFEANDSTPDQLVSNDQSETSYDPETLSYNTHYYWQIVATDDHGASTSGAVWDFTTGSAPPSETNIALSATASASSTYGDGFSYTYYCNDGDPATQWSGDDRNFVASDYYWLQLDFGSSATFSSVSLKAFRREAGQETWLSWSSNGSTWTEIAGTRYTDGAGESSQKDYDFGTLTARYIRVNFNWPSSGAQPSLGEFEVYGSL